MRCNCKYLTMTNAELDEDLQKLAENPIEKSDLEFGKRVRPHAEPSPKPGEIAYQTEYPGLYYIFNLYELNRHKYRWYERIFFVEFWRELWEARNQCKILRSLFG